MKKFIFSALFSLMGIIASAQVNVGNSTGFPLTVGVQFANPMSPCIPVFSITSLIVPDGSQLFNAPPGLIVMRVGANGFPGAGFEYLPCGGCIPSTPGPYFFNWSPDCSHVKIL